MLVGDHRQLAAVGPGGALAALLDRRPDLAVTLDHNVRQHDPAERQRPRRAAIRLRCRPPSTGTPRRPDPTPSRHDSTRSPRWPTPGPPTSTPGTTPLLLAWTRADVADLNRLARAPLATARPPPRQRRTRSTGAATPSATSIVALAPNPAAGFVTSERLTITGASDAALIARRQRRPPGRPHRRRHRRRAPRPRLRHHRPPRPRRHLATAPTSSPHGGGRELAYVALSRARDHTTIHATADDLAQAVDDLQADWSVERHQRWITDTAANDNRHATDRSIAARPPARPAPIDGLLALERDVRDLYAGSGRWQSSPAGAAARALKGTSDALKVAQTRAARPDLRRRDRRNTTKAIPQLTANLDTARRQWQTVGQPIADDLQARIRRVREQITRETQRRPSPAIDWPHPSIACRDTGHGLDR